MVVITLRRTKAGGFLGDYRAAGQGGGRLSQISLSPCLGTWFARMNRSAIAATISVSDTWHQGGDGDEEVGGAGEAVSF